MLLFQLQVRQVCQNSGTPEEPAELAEAEAEATAAAAVEARWAAAEHASAAAYALLTAAAVAAAEACKSCLWMPLCGTAVSAMHGLAFGTVQTCQGADVGILTVLQVPGVERRQLDKRKKGDKDTCRCGDSCLHDKKHLRIVTIRDCLASLDCHGEGTVDSQSELQQCTIYSTLIG